MLHWVYPQVGSLTGFAASERSVRTRFKLQMGIVSLTY